MNVEIQQPQPFDLVGSTILVSGLAVGFEGHLTISATDGHDEVIGSAMAGSTAIRQFQGELAVPPTTAFQLDRLFLTVADDGGGGEGGPPPMVTVPVLFGPLILPGFTGYREYTVLRGDSLTGIAQQQYGDGSKWTVIRAANQHFITNPDLIFPGQVLRIPRND